MRRRLLFIAPLAVVGFAAFIALGGVLVMLLWNWLLPGLFGLRQITFWQALGLLALCRILFGGFRLSGARRYGRRERMAERWERMTPEDREKWRARCDRWTRRPAADVPRPSSPDSTPSA